ncbi:hypothetical protein ACKWTF_010445 [Chironomus riparius]
MDQTFKGDPLEYFPYEISEKILLYLPVKNLMRVSAVNSLWYDFIGQSKNLMKNVKVKMQRKAINPTLTSTRNYETLEINNMDGCMDAIFEQLKSRKWSNIIINDMTFLTTEQAVKMFSLIQESVKNLDIRDCFLYSNIVNKNHGLMFPNLKIFSATTTEYSFKLIELFQNVRHLTQFDLISNGLSVAGLITANNILNTNEKLKILSISNTLFNPLFIEKITIPSKIKKLSLLHDSYHEDGYYDKYYKNLISLIHQHSDSLETIIIDEHVNEDVVKEIFKLPKLKHLKITGFTKSDVMDVCNDLKLTINASIKKLDILVGPKSYKIIKAMIVAAPNLNSLSVLFINSKTLKFISQNSPNLRKLSIEYLNIAYLPRDDAFKNLEYLDVQNYKPSLRKNLLRKNFYALSHFEKLMFLILIRQKFVHI